MPLSKQPIERLIDLAENKLSCIFPIYRDGIKGISELEFCVQQLSVLQSTAPGRNGARHDGLRRRLNRRSLLRGARRSRTRHPTPLRLNARTTPD